METKVGGLSATSGVSSKRRDNWTRWEGLRQILGLATKVASKKIAPVVFSRRIAVFVGQEGNNQTSWPPTESA